MYASNAQITLLNAQTHLKFC